MISVPIITQRSRAPIIANNLSENTPPESTKEEPPSTPSFHDTSNTHNLNPETLLERHKQRASNTSSKTTLNRAIYAINRGKDLRNPNRSKMQIFFGELGTRISLKIKFGTNIKTLESAIAPQHIISQSEIRRLFLKDRAEAIAKNTAATSQNENPHA